MTSFHTGEIRFIYPCDETAHPNVTSPVGVVHFEVLLERAPIRDHRHPPPRSWLAELETYDEDPSAWDRAYFTRLVRNFAAEHGLERAARFGAKLVEHGHLSSADVEQLLAE
jgi:hypothetical protein